MSPDGKATVAITLGDPAGIGPELAAKLVARSDLMTLARVVVIGDRWVWEKGQEVANLRLALPEVASFGAAAARDGSPAFLPVESVKQEDVTPSVAGPACGASVLHVLRLCMDAATAGSVDAICFAPLNKLAMKMGGLDLPDELHFCARHLRYGGFLSEINVLGGLWTSRVTSHIPLREVAAAIDPEKIGRAIRLIHEALVRSGVARPRIAVAALNPHAGEGGTCGTEEIDIIEPAIRASRAQGFPAEGPFPADTVFIKARAQDFDAIVTMYHDQGQIALKLLGFNRGVTVQGGLPVAITTPAHGTAFDIVGRNRADPGAMIEAFRIAAAMGAKR
jgi:4-hydroxythreonine-4-phosphate dehydrogenase